MVCGPSRVYNCIVMVQYSKVLEANRSGRDWNSGPQSGLCNSVIDSPIKQGLITRA